MGASDYVKKPFELEELNVRIRHVQKIFNIETLDALTINETISFSPSQKQLNKGEEIIPLSAKDCKILTYFLNNAGRVVTNDELIHNVWEFDSMPSDATIRSHVRTIRELIGKDAIRTIRGEGYLYE